MPTPGALAIHTPTIGSLLNILTDIYKAIDSIKTNKQRCLELADQCKCLLMLLDESREVSHSYELADALSQTERTMKRIALKMREWSERSFMERMVRKDDIDQVIPGLEEELELCKSCLHTNPEYERVLDIRLKTPLASTFSGGGSETRRSLEMVFAESENRMSVASMEMRDSVIVEEPRWLDRLAPEVIDLDPLEFPQSVNSGDATPTLEHLLQNSPQSATFPETYVWQGPRTPRRFYASDNGADFSLSVPSNIGRTTPNIWTKFQRSSTTLPELYSPSSPISTRAVVSPSPITELPPSSIPIIKRNADDTLSAGNVEGLIDHLIPSMGPGPKADHTFVDVFLMTYRSFTTGEVILDRLSTTFQSIMADPDASAEQRVDMRYSILGILKKWLKIQYLGSGDTAALEKMRQLVLMASISISTRSAIHALVHSLIRQFNAIEASESSDDTSISRGTKTKADLCGIPPKVLAQHLTLYESQYYRKIVPSECVSWLRELGEDSRPNLARFLAVHDNILAWVKKVILRLGRLEPRREHVEYFISVANECLQLRNYKTMATIITALQSSVLTRLSHTQRKISQASNTLLRNLKKVIDNKNSYASYYTDLNSSNRATIPNFGLPL
ncbi:hypothetical protein BOTBODRAFT_550188 [Botryobasidium botryosum FD-172 SS1]|uniref:Ras-GEF domain-containing protein n=1 Tax=Botryobasidium botryosum (strain FD-172 SS1) TaxID=930990 RepID=A0A067N1S8_BOTB1|nr:hypothetical protein BOTBODRAFT_550188 [Botryobasidium botryosum FD-172 SS1]